MADHAALTPTFRDFSYFRNSTDEKTDRLPKPTVREVENILTQSPAGLLGQAVSTEGWPWLERMNFMDAVIPGIRFHSLGGIVPFQADGTWGPYEFYYRERHGYAELRLAPIATFPGPSEALYSAKSSAPEFAGSTGWLTRFLELWEKLSIAPFLYRFQARDVNIHRSDESEGADFRLVFGEGFTDVAGWGFDAEEARRSALTVVPFYEEQFGWTPELQQERFRAMEVAELPLNSDDRTFPEETPHFGVIWEALAVTDDLSHFTDEYVPPKTASEPTVGATGELLGALANSSSSPKTTTAS